MEIEDIIILILTIIIIFFIFDRKRENFESESSPSPSLVNKESESSPSPVIKELELEGYKLMPVPNFYEVFGSTDTSKSFTFYGYNNWKLFTNTTLIENKGLASLICSDNPPFYNIFDKPPYDKNIRMTGFSISNNGDKFKTSVVIGLMTPTLEKPYNSGQWLKSFEWYGYSKLDDNKKNAQDVIIWANRKQSDTKIEINESGEIVNADKLLKITIPQNATSTSPISFVLDNYDYTKRKKEISPYTTYYFQILNNRGDPNTVIVSAIVPHFEI